MSVILKIAAAFAFALVVAAGGWYYAYFQTRAAFAELREEGQPERITRLSETLTAQYRALEASQQGYIITGDTLYLEAYAATVGQLPATMKQMYALPARSPELNAQLASLDSLFDKKLNEFTVTMKLRQEYNLIKPAADFMRKNKSRAASDSVRALLTRLRAAQALPAAERSQEAERRTVGATLPALGAALFALALGFAAIFFVMRSAKSEFRAFVASVERWALGDFSARAETPAQPELRPLATVLNAMAAQVKGDRASTKISSNLAADALNATPSGFAALKAVRDASLTGAGKIIDFEWQIANTAAASLFGASSAALVGARLLAGSPRRQAETLFEQCLRALEEGKTVETPQTLGARRVMASVAKFGDGVTLVISNIA